MWTPSGNLGMANRPFPAAEPEYLHLATNLKQQLTLLCLLNLTLSRNIMMSSTQCMVNDEEMQTGIGLEESVDTRSCWRAFQEWGRQAPQVLPQA